MTGVTHNEIFTSFVNRVPTLSVSLFIRCWRTMDKTQRFVKPPCLSNTLLHFATLLHVSPVFFVLKESNELQGGNKKTQV